MPATPPQRPRSGAHRRPEVAVARVAQPAVAVQAHGGHERVAPVVLADDGGGRRVLVDVHRRVRHPAELQPGAQPGAEGAPRPPVDDETVLGHAGTVLAPATVVNGGAAPAPPPRPRRPPPPRAGRGRPPPPPHPPPRGR